MSQKKRHSYAKLNWSHFFFFRFTNLNSSEDKNFLFFFCPEPFMTNSVAKTKRVSRTSQVACQIDGLFVFLDITQTLRRMNADGEDVVV